MKSAAHRGRGEAAALGEAAFGAAAIGAGAFLAATGFDAATGFFGATATFFSAATGFFGATAPFFGAATGFFGAIAALFGTDAAVTAFLGEAGGSHRLRLGAEEGRAVGNGEREDKKGDERAGLTSKTQRTVEFRKLEMLALCSR